MYGIFRNYAILGSLGWGEMCFVSGHCLHGEENGRSSLLRSSGVSPRVSPDYYQPYRLTWREFLVLSLLSLGLGGFG